MKRGEIMSTFLYTKRWESTKMRWSKVCWRYFVPLYQKMREYQNNRYESSPIVIVPLYQKMREYQNTYLLIVRIRRVPLYQKMREYQNSSNAQPLTLFVPLYQKMREYQNRKHNETESVIGSFIPKDERVPKCTGASVNANVKFLYTKRWESTKIIGGKNERSR